MRKKAVFFDIDGTIWDRENYIPDSTIAAIRGLRENGHLAFLCSGRSRGYIRNPKLFDIGFDGVVSGCGTMIEYEGETIFYKKLDIELVEWTIKTVRSYGFKPILEGREYLYMDMEEFGDDLYGKKLKAEMGEDFRGINDSWGKWEISKLSCTMDGADQAGCFAQMEPYYDPLIHNSSVVEFVPKGFSKGTGIRKVCELLNMEVEDTISFGDSVNDLAMLKTAGVGVAMGNGSKEAKDAADYVTTSLYEDGIWNGCQYLNLLTPKEKKRLKN
jgi:hypothetical protein